MAKPDRDAIAKVSAKLITDRVTNQAREIRDEICQEKCGGICDKPPSRLLLNDLFEMLWEDYAKLN